LDFESNIVNLSDDKKRGKYILTGSNNFLFQESISQSLAGRIAYLNLLPFTVSELPDKGSCGYVQEGQDNC
jgi:hypothetical protein